MFVVGATKSAQAAARRANNKPRNYAHMQMKTLCGTSDGQHRDFMLMKLDRSNNFAVVQKAEINFKLSKTRKLDEESGAIRRAHQAAEDICRHVGDDMDVFLFQKGWDKILNASKPWKHLNCLNAYLKKFRSQLTVPRTKLLWKDNASLRMTTVYKRSTLTAGFGKAIKVIASDWMTKFAASLGIRFPLFRYVSLISERSSLILLMRTHSFKQLVYVHAISYPKQIVVVPSIALTQCIHRCNTNSYPSHIPNRGPIELTHEMEVVGYVMPPSRF